MRPGGDPNTMSDSNATPHGSDGMAGPHGSADDHGDGEADVHELFSNAFAQTADMREFPSTLRLGPKGEFVLAKGGQEATTLGKHNGSVLRLSADGRQAEVLGYGLRQPNLSVHPVTGLVLASDQQGQYVPSTPIHLIQGRQFYGFLSDKLPKEQYPAPIAAPSPPPCTFDKIEPAAGLPSRSTATSARRWFWTR